MEMCCPDSPSRKDLLPQLLGLLSADRIQLSAPLGVNSAAECCLTQGQTFPRAAHIQWLVAVLDTCILGIPWSSWSLSCHLVYGQSIILRCGVWCLKNLKNPAKCFCFLFMVAGTRSRSLSFNWNACPSMPLTTGSLSTLLKWQISESL